MKISTIFIDIGMVLVDLDFRPAFQEVSQLSGLSHDQIRTRLTDYRDILEYEKGRLTTAQFHQGLSRLLQIEVSLEHFQQIWRSVLIFDGKNGADLLSASLFRQLKTQHRLIALSNTNEMQFEYLSSSHPVVADFDDYVLSYRVGHLKPERKIYQQALEAANCPPEEALFIDDLAENVEAARELGITGIVFQGETRLREELGRLEITIP